jgi:hypothetical protein
MTKLYTYTKDYRDGFKAAYILGPTAALAQIHKWEQEALEVPEPQQPQPEPQ